MRARLPSVVCAAALVIPTGAAVAAPDCPAAVALRGEGSAVDSVRDELARRGVATELSVGCEGVSVEVRDDDGAVGVTITDGAGRRAERRLAGARGAASLVESWARDEVTGSLLSPPMAPMAAPVTMVSLGAVPDEGSLLRRVARGRRVVVSLASEVGVAPDGSRSLGVVAGGCVRVGPLCAGAVVRANKNLRFGDAEKATELARGAIDVLASIDLPVALGPVTMTPGVTGGVGWVETTGIPGGELGMTVHERVATASGRTGARLVFTAPLGGGLALDLGASVDWALGAHEDRFVFVASEADCTTWTHLPGEPTTRVHAGAGLRWEIR